MSTKQQFKCEECYKIFFKLVGLKRHLLIHSKENPKFNCEYDNCNYSSNRKDQLQCHINNIHLKHLQCEYCDYKTGSNQSMKNHIMTHTGENPYKCDFEGCEYSCTNSSYLIQHKRIHTKEKPYLCDFEGCGFRTAQQGHLGVHKRMHTQQRNYKCDFEGCDFSCAVNDTLKKHQTKTYRSETI